MHILKDNSECVNAFIDDKGWIRTSVIIENSDISEDDLFLIYDKNKDKIQFSDDRIFIRAYYKSRYDK